MTDSITILLETNGNLFSQLMNSFTHIGSFNEMSMLLFPLNFELRVSIVNAKCSLDMTYDLDIFFSLFIGHETERNAFFASIHIKSNDISVSDPFSFFFWHVGN